MGNQKLEDLKADRIKYDKIIDDPETLTHYLGNDEYLFEEMNEPDSLEPDGFCALGNDELRKKAELALIFRYYL